MATCWDILVSIKSIRGNCAAPCERFVACGWKQLKRRARCVVAPASVPALAVAPYHLPRLSASPSLRTSSSTEAIHTTFLSMCVQMSQPALESRKFLQFDMILPFLLVIRFASTRRSHCPASDRCPQHMAVATTSSICGSELRQSALASIGRLTVEICIMKSSHLWLHLDAPVRSRRQGESTTCPSLSAASAGQ